MDVLVVDIIAPDRVRIMTYIKLLKFINVLKILVTIHFWLYLSF